jgi:hypothetical protein
VKYTIPIISEAAMDSDMGRWSNPSPDSGRGKEGQKENQDQNRKDH